MKYRTDGRSGNRLSILGFGCMRFPRNIAGTDMRKTEELVMRAVDGGVNFFDTAWLYPGNEEALGAVLERNGVIWRGGSVIDATIIEAPGSTKNADRSRDLEMAHAKKGNAWHFGMKAHIGADAGTGMVHTVEFTAANVNDVTKASVLVRKDDEVVYADAGYTGIGKREEVVGDGNLSKVDWRVSPRPGKAKALEANLREDAANYQDWAAQPRRDALVAYQLSKVRSRVEHSFYVVKRLFGYGKTRYRGLVFRNIRFAKLRCR